MKTLVLTILFSLLLPAFSFAACTAPAANEGAIEYFSAANTHKFCDGTNWLSKVPINCTGASNGLQWDGTAWSCPSVSGGGGSGSFQFSDTADVCDGTTAGLVMYDSVGFLKMCDGTAWDVMFAKAPCALWEAGKRVSCSGSVGFSSFSAADKAACQANCEANGGLACQWTVGTTTCRRYTTCTTYGTATDATAEAVQCLKLPVQPVY